MKRKIHALLLALLLVFSAALTAGAAGYSGSCRPGYRFWQLICTRDPGLCRSNPRSPRNRMRRIRRPNRIRPRSRMTALPSQPMSRRSSRS